MSRYFLVEYKVATKVCVLCNEKKILHDFAKAYRSETTTGKCKDCIKKTTKDSIDRQLSKNAPCDYRFFGRIK